MSVRPANVVTFPVVPRLRVSGEHPPKPGCFGATIVILPMIRIEHYRDDGASKRRRDRRDDWSNWPSAE